MNYIIEYLGSEGVKTSPLTAMRWQTPHPGDAVLFPDGRYGMIEGLGRGFARADEYHVCESPAGVFLGLSSEVEHPPYVDISGGPFIHIHRSRLHAAFSLHTFCMWNWGDHSPGAHQGVEYLITRPVFRLLSSNPQSAIRTPH